MKKALKFAALAAAAMVLAVLPGRNVLQASAASTTFYVKYDTASNDWRMQVGSWNDEDKGRESYYLNNGDDKVKDGDVLVVLPNDSGAAGNAALTVNARLSNLTTKNSRVVIATNGVDDCFVLGDSYAAISGDVTNAYVYDNATCTFNNNVTNLNLISSAENRVYTVVSVKGTVAYASEANPGGILNEYYNFAADKFVFDGVTLKTDPAYYSKTGTAPAAAQPAEAPAAAPSAGSSAGEYDDVPKTGESNLILLLLCISGICFAGRFALKKAM